MVHVEKKIKPRVHIYRYRKLYYNGDAEKKKSPAPSVFCRNPVFKMPEDKYTRSHTEQHMDIFRNNIIAKV